MTYFNKAGQGQVRTWLGLGVIMVLVQILLGGITRLTGSGLSITEWQPLIGTLPPLSRSAWLQSFTHYRQIAQFKKINYQFTLADYQGLYFWEWLHREWARIMGMAFVIPLALFIRKKKISKALGWQLAGLFILATVQGFAGWLMVSSGLNDTDVTVSHIRLAIHLMLATCLLVYLYRIFLRLNPGHVSCYVSNYFRRLSWLILFILGLQLIYGAFMAGTHAALYAPTWPSINGVVFISSPGISGGLLRRITYDPFLIQFIHRLLAYLLSCLFPAWFFLSRRSSLGSRFKTLVSYPLVLLGIQVLLGIGCLLHATSSYYNWLAAVHQLNGILLLLSMVRVIFASSYRPILYG